MQPNQPMKNGIPTYLDPVEEARLRRDHPRLDLDGMETTLSDPRPRRFRCRP
jgi:hypothetical protein